jgi:uncharacterized protein
LASVAIPNNPAPLADLRAFLGRPLVGAGVAASLFLGATAGLVHLVGPMGPQTASARISMASVIKAAPPGWGMALRAASGPVQVTQDVVRLSENAQVIIQARAETAPAAIAIDEGLPQAPLAGFFMDSAGGPLPIIAEDGRTPAEVYARPFVGDGRPRIALVIGGLGLNAHLTRTAIETLPPEVTLAFSPYAPGLQGWIDMARAHGHEVLLEAPLEPLDYPDNDPGPYTLMTLDKPAETARKLEWVMSRASGYFGLTNELGSRFLRDDAAYQGFAEAVRARGLAFVDDGAGARRGGGLMRASAERTLDNPPSPLTLDQQFAALEAGAQQRGQALGSGAAYPVTLEKARVWAQSVGERGFQLAPASALTVQR